jgi:hypothetical protein
MPRPQAPLNRANARSVFIVVKAADDFKDKNTAPNQPWQTDFTYLKVVGWGWFYLSTILDDFSRYIIAYKLCTTMKAEDITDTLELALKPVSRRCQARSSHDLRTRGGAKGLEVSLCSLCQDQLVQRQVRHRTSKAGVLDLEFLEPLYLVALQATILIPPPIIRHFRQANRSDRVYDRPTLCDQNINLPQLRNNLFSRMPLLCPRPAPPSENHTSGRTASKGADHRGGN